MPRLSKIGAAALAAFGWTGLASVSASYLVVAGGGSGGDARDSGSGTSAGGGAGGLLTGTTSLNPTLSYTVTVGAGGAAISGANARGNNGSDSTLNTITSTGGGGGGAALVSPPNGKNGGSGGGGSEVSSGGTGVSGQGFAGGGGGTGSASGGGGGSSAVGADGTSGASGAGGAGTASSISGSSVTYAGGGGGGASSNKTRGVGGSGGGGNGGNDGAAGSNGTANLGGGGGASGANGGNPSGSGGSGVVIISYPAPQQFGGGVVTTSGSNVIHTFNTSGTLAPLSSLTASYLIVAGGGAGGVNQGGGGGAGGLLTGSGLTIDTNSNYVVVVGAGATQTGNNATTANGTNSSFSGYATAAVGGGGAGGYTTAGASGGSGGGGGGANGSASSYAGGAGTSGQGFAGGTGTAVGVYTAGGGGGASAVGANSTITVGGNGGAGTASSISGTSVTYAGGGGGGVYAPAGQTPGSGGAGGGGTGGGTTGAVAGTNGTANLGGGGGGGAGSGGLGGNGGSGVVIISYAGATQQMAGGTVTISGGNVIHTFTSSGYLTPIKYVNNSLRFRNSASAYLSRTPATAGNTQKWTMSFWLKRGSLSQSRSGVYSTTGTVDYIEFGGGYGQYDFEVTLNNASGARIATNALYRDPAAWYHFVIAIDTTQATASNRMLLYVNGIQITSFVSASYPAQNYNTAINSAVAQYIGADYSLTSGQYFDGYMTEYNFIDGQQLTPNSFGTINSYGVWQPITYGGSYGTNGFYLPFTANSTSTYAASFNGSSQYIYLGGQSNFAFGTGDFTVEMWVNNNSFAVAPVYYDGRPTSTNGAYPTIYAISGSLRYFTNGGDAITSYTVMSTGVWYHAAVVRSGATTTLYLNGVSQGTYSDSQNYLNGASVRPCIGVSNAGLNLFNGYMSNLRVVKGTAVYTANFTPPTSPLTAITNTQLLTLQNATIVDNSTNAFTITNVGTTATAIQYPFNVFLFNDKSSAGNNWTPNSISLVNGSTYDSMTDVPTLTSATAANYAVLNPLDRNTTNPTDGNLTWNNGTANHYAVRGTISPTSGKWYFESYVGTATGVMSLSAGVCTATAALDFASANQWFMYTNASTTAIEINGTQTVCAGFSVPAVGDILQVAYDANTNSVWLGKNNVWSNSTGGTTGNPSAGTNATATSLPTGLFPYIECYSAVTNTNFGQRPFSYTPPTGFVALNTYNL